MLEEPRARIAALEEALRSVYAGREAVVRTLVVGLLAGGHILLEDVPGVGKTTLGRALASALEASFRRVQFTPDMLPADVLGVSLYSTSEQAFVFHPGPIFTQVLLADELNRTPPRTQSALLEAMAESQVTQDGETHALPDPFIVLATMNPVDSQGTYELPESQADRFLVRIKLGYPGREEERRLLRGEAGQGALEGLSAVMPATDLPMLQAAAAAVAIQPALEDYLLDVVAATRESTALEVGASPRALLALQSATKALAFLEGRDYATADDVKAVALPVLAHRLVALDPGPDASEQVLRQLLDGLEVPR